MNSDSTSRVLWTALACLLASVAPACGSSVESPGSGGQGGEGASGASGPGANGSGASGGDAASSSSGSPSSSSTSSNVGGSSTGCAGACDNLEALGCTDGGPDCVQECQNALGSRRCARQFGVVIGCVAAMQTCDIEDNCAGPLEAWVACQESNGCGPAECSSGGTSGGEEQCACNAICNGQPVEAACSSFNGGQATCTCYVSGMIVAECTEPTSSFCDLESGCCAQFF